MSYTYATRIRDAIVTDLSQFVSTDSGTNLGIGYSGWDDAYRYSRDNDLEYFGSVFLTSGDDDSPKAMGYGMWRWGYIVRVHIKFDVASSTTPDEKIATVADGIMGSMLSTANMATIAPGGHVRLVAANYVGEPENINSVTYLTMDFLVSVKEQIVRG